MTREVKNNEGGVVEISSTDESIECNQYQEGGCYEKNYFIGNGA